MSRRATERITDDQILNKVRHFGPLRTPQLLRLLGLAPHGSLQRLKKCRGLRRELVAGVNVWSA